MVLNQLTTIVLLIVSFCHYSLNYHLIQYIIFIIHISITYSISYLQNYINPIKHR